MNKDLQRLNYLWDKYKSNDCTPDELDEFLKILQQPWVQEALDDSLYQEWHEAEPSTSATSQPDWEKMLSVIQATKSTSSNRAKAIRLPYAVVAALLIVCLAGFYFYRHNRSVDSDAIMLTFKASQTVDTLTLPDGSVAILNAGTTISYRKDFIQQTRDLYLDGEAFLDVVPSKEHAFVVHSNQLETTVHGTSFVVNSYAGVNEQEVSVLTGKVSVKVKKTDKEVLLLPNQKAFFQAQAQTLIRQDIPDAKDALRWQEGIWVLENMRLADAVKQLDIKYARKTVIESIQLEDCRVSASLPKLSYQEILVILSNITNSEIKEKNGQQILYGDGCPLY